MIDILVNEHKNIKIVLEAIEKLSKKVLLGEEIDVELYRKIIDFVRSYADKYHHRKEENYVFNKMMNSKQAEGPVQGMLLEHDMGRKYISNLEAAVNEYEKGNSDARLRIITYAIAYKDLLSDHIFKEDNVIYKFALRVIPEDEIKNLEVEFKDIEANSENTETRERYLKFVEELKERFDIK